MEGFLQGLALFVAGAVLSRLAQIWRRLDEAEREMGRSKRDHGYWLTRRKWELEDELAAINEDFMFAASLTRALAWNGAIRRTSDSMRN